MRRLQTTKNMKKHQPPSFPIIYVSLHLLPYNRYTEKHDYIMSIFEDELNTMGESKAYQRF